MDEKIVKDSQCLVNDLANDCISRQAAISHVDDVPYIKDHPNLGLLWKAWIESLPSAQPERKTGKWIDAVIPNDNGGLPVQVCDQCNTFFPLAYTGGGHRFCPNCGADMRDEQDG